MRFKTEARYLRIEREKEKKEDANKPNKWCQSETAGNLLFQIERSVSSFRS
jgi:hypothetical protein